MYTYDFTVWNLDSNTSLRSSLGDDGGRQCACVQLRPSRSSVAVDDLWLGEMASDNGLASLVGLKL